MNKSVVLTITILVIGAIPALFQAKRRHSLKEANRALVSEAEELGIATGFEESDGRSRYSKRPRSGQRKKASLTAADVISYALKMERLDHSGEEVGDDDERRGLEILKQLQRMDPDGLKMFIEEIRSDSDLTPQSRGNIVAHAIMMLSENHPQAAVALFAESGDLVSSSMMGDHVLSSAVSRWAEQDPVAALEWIKANSKKYPEAAGDWAKEGVLSGTALRDPKLAFQLFDEIGFEHPENALDSILSSGEGDPEHRNLVLGALREHLQGMPDAEEREDLRSAAFEIFARNAEEEGYESLTKWMGESNFSEEEKAMFAGGLSYFATKQETGQWMDWLAQNVTGEEMKEPVAELISEWTQQDYVAAGTWLSGAADGPAKTAAVESYAEVVAEYDPQVAGQWAMTLPPGPGRNATLRAVHENWPESDPQGAAAFASEHGLH